MFLNGCFIALFSSILLLIGVVLYEKLKQKILRLPFFTLCLIALLSAFGILLSPLIYSMPVQTR